MLQLNCPWCGLRHETEFENGGPVRATRPENATELSDDEWREFLMMRPNDVGPLRERWWHARGCNRWFEITRDTVTHEILDH